MDDSDAAGRISATVRGGAWGKVHRAEAARVVVALAVSLAVAVFAEPARADPAPGPARFGVGFTVGTRVAPGLALAGALDLDVYLDRARVFSLGPGVAVSAFGGDGGRPDQQQSLLVAVDVARFKLAVNGGGGAFRPTFYAGFGFFHASLPAASVTTTVVQAGGAGITGEARHPALTELGGMVTFGAGVDVFLGRNLAVTALGQPHLRVWGSARVPDVWTELTLGLRVGL